jgi:hypothetical protein
MRGGLRDPDYWWQRAAEARTAASSMPDTQARRTLLGIADGYEQLARQSERLIERDKRRR